MKPPDPRHIVAHASCRLEPVGEVCYEQADCGDIWVDEVEMITIAEVKESSCLTCLNFGGAWMKRIRGQVLGRLLELEQ